MSFNTIELCSKALSRIGANGIVSFDEGTAEAEVAGSIYQIVKQKLLASYPWGFATETAALARIAGEEAFALPGDFLRAVGVLPRREYRIQGRRLYSDAEKVELTYIRDAAEEEFPAQFTAALVSTLAAEFALALLDDTARHNLLARAAAAELKEAKLADSQQASPKRIRSFPLIDSRK